MAKHIENIKQLDVQRRPGPQSDNALPAQPAVPIINIFDLAASRLFQELGDPTTPREPLPPVFDFIDESQKLSPEFQPLARFNWDDFEGVHAELHGPHHARESIQELSSYMLNMFEHGPDNVGSDDDLSDGERSESSDAERPDVEDGDEFNIRGSDAFNPYSGLTNKRQRTDLAVKSPEWFPWPNRTACTLDILMHLPRSVFSVRQLDLFLWLLRVNGIEDATSVKTMKDLDTKLQKLYGIQTYKYKGAFGHLYYEMCNPQVRNHLSFYPEDCGAENLSEAWQFARWLHEIPDDELGPMVRLGPAS
ncbi:hypothetical protein EV368DRAFT_70453 [Lentinula lateritia]|nr:hypothetical protein EV368DRAFT_70453 [Lentinula lateritia]